MTLRERRLLCNPCNTVEKRWLWNTDPVPPCPACGAERELDGVAVGKSAAVIGDEIDIMVPHGLCNADGSPRRYRSRSELYRDMRNHGWSHDMVQHQPLPGTDKSPFTTRWV